MADHDPLCFRAHTRDGRCTCTYVATVRADERERIVAWLYDLREDTLAEMLRNGGEG